MFDHHGWKLVAAGFLAISSCAIGAAVEPSNEICWLMGVFVGWWCHGLVIAAIEQAARNKETTT